MSDGDKKSELSAVTVADIDNLESVMAKYGWTPDRQVNADRHIRKLRKLGYEIHDAALKIFTEFSGLKTNVHQLNQFAGFSSDTGGLVAVGQLTSERIFFSSHAICKGGEGKEVTEYFRSIFETVVVRIGHCKRNADVSGLEHVGSSGLGIFFAGADGKIYEISEFQGGCQLGIYSSLGNYLALKCLPLECLIPSMIPKVFSRYPEESGMVSFQKEEKLDQIGIYLGIG